MAKVPLLAFLLYRVPDGARSVLEVGWKAARDRNIGIVSLFYMGLSAGSSQRRFADSESNLLIEEVARLLRVYGQNR